MRYDARKVPRMDNSWVALRYEDRCRLRKQLLDEAAAELIHAVQQVEGVLAVYAYGSYARGVIGPDSDFDALIVRETDLPRLQREDDIRSRLRSTCCFDLLVLRPDEYAHQLPANSVGRGILAEAKLLCAV